MAVQEGPIQATHVLGLDFGGSNIRVQISHADGVGNVSDPEVVALPGGNPDGALPNVLELDARNAIRAVGREALGSMGRAGITNTTHIFDYKTAIAQTPADLAALKWPERARMCTNPSCVRPGTPWPAAMSRCGFCGAPLATAASVDGGLKPAFRYTREEALVYCRLMIAHISNRLQYQLGVPIHSTGGWAVAAGVPSYWQDETLNSFEDAVRAGFDGADVYLFRNHEAVMQTYARANVLTAPQGTRTVVLDMGSDTTEVSIVEMTVGYDRIRANSKHTYTELFGGSDFDIVLAQYAASQLGSELTASTLAHWKRSAREWKEVISAQLLLASARSGDGRATAVSAPFARGTATSEVAFVSLTGDTFEQESQGLHERFRSILKRSLEQFDVATSKISCAALAGGGAHWYFVNDEVKRLLPGATLLVSPDPELLTSAGLALAAHRQPPRTDPRRDREQPRRNEPHQPPLQHPEVRTYVADVILPATVARQGSTQNVTTAEGITLTVTIPGDVVDRQERTFEDEATRSQLPGGTGKLVVRFRVEPEVRPTATAVGSYDLSALNPPTPPLPRDAAPPHSASVPATLASERYPADQPARSRLQASLPSNRKKGLVGTVAAGPALIAFIVLVTLMGKRLNPSKHASVAPDAGVSVPIRSPVAPRVGDYSGSHNTETRSSPAALGSILNEAIARARSADRYAAAAAADRASAESSAQAANAAQYRSEATHHANVAHRAANDARNQLARAQKSVNSARDLLDTAEQMSAGLNGQVGGKIDSARQRVQAAQIVAGQAEQAAGAAEQLAAEAINAARAKPDRPVPPQRPASISVSAARSMLGYLNLGSKAALISDASKDPGWQQPDVSVRRADEDSGTLSLSNCPSGYVQLYFYHDSSGRLLPQLAAGGRYANDYRDAQPQAISGGADYANCDLKGVTYVVALIYTGGSPSGDLASRLRSANSGQQWRIAGCRVPAQ